MTMTTREVLPPPPTSADALIEWRAALKFTQREAALALGCSRTALQNWEARVNEVPPFIGLAMAEVSRRYRPRRERAAPTLAPG
jgi:DNA-binding transcriptional regulator YiaG